MSIVSWAVIGVALLTTVGLVLYVNVVLPGRLDQRTLQSIRAFGTAIELRFPSHRGLTVEVVSLALELGRRLKLHPAEMRDLEFAAHLRDIGLCAIPYNLVNGRDLREWSEAERITYDRHAEVGGAMLEFVPSLRHLAPIVRHHHMRHDDFPRVRDGQDFRPSLATEVLNVASAYAWLARWQGELLAKEQILRERGTVYHPAVVDAFRDVITSPRVESPNRRLVL